MHRKAISYVYDERYDFFLKALLAFLSFPIIAFSFHNLLWNSILEEGVIKNVDTEHVLS